MSASQINELMKLAKQEGRKLRQVSPDLLDKFAAADTDERKQKLAQRAVRKDKKFERQKFGASFATALAAGLEAEGKRRESLGLSGAGFAAAFKSGVQPLIDFNAQMNVDAQQKIKQLGFVSISNALEAEKKKNEGVSNAVESAMPAPPLQEQDPFASPTMDSRLEPPRFL